MTAAYAHTWRVRVRGQQRVIGAGTLVADRTVLTCAHVVARALGADQRGGPPAGMATVDFPGSASREGTPAAVDPEGWRPVGAPGGGDLALLRLAADPPADVRPATLRPCGDPAGREVQAFGHPSGLDAGAWARARLIGYGGPEPDWVQFDGVPTGRAITGGFSGAGVVDAAGHVIGMVVAEDRQPDARVAWMIPVEACVDRLPPLADLKQPSPDPAVGPTHPMTVVGPSTAGRGGAPVAVADLQRLARAVAEVPVMRDADSRRQIVDALRPAIAGNVPYHAVRAVHVFGILRTCLDYPGGLTELVGVIKTFADESVSVARVDDLIAEMGLDGA